jgi:hypothetical protein
MIGSAIGLLGMHYWQVYEGTLNTDPQPTKITTTTRNEDADTDHKIALVESKGSIKL